MAKIKSKNERGIDTNVTRLVKEVHRQAYTLKRMAAPYNMDLGTNSKPKQRKYRMININGVLVKQYIYK